MESMQMMKTHTMRRVRKGKIHHMKADREIFYAYFGNTAINLDLYLWAVLVWQWQNWLCLSETCLKRQHRSKVPPNARCVLSYNFSTQKVNVQRKFTNKLLLFMVTLWFPLVSSPKETSDWEKVRWRWWGARRSHDVVQRAGGRFLWVGNTEAGSMT